MKRLARGVEDIGRTISAVRAANTASAFEAKKKKK